MFDLGKQSSRCSRLGYLVCILVSLASFLPSCAGYRIGLLADTSVERGRRYVDWAQFAVEDLAADVSLEIMANSTRSSIDLATYASLDQLFTHKVYALVGPMSSAEGQGVGYNAAAVQTAMMVPLAAAIFSDKTTYPTVFRMRPNDKDSAYPLIRLLIAMKWSHVGVITTSDAYGTGLASTLETSKVALAKMGTSMNVHTAFFEALPSPNAYSSALAGFKTLLSEGVRIFWFHSTTANSAVLIKIMRELNMLNNPKYQLVFTADMADQMATSTDITAAELKGCLGFLLSYPKTTRLNQLAVRSAAKGYTAFRIQDLMAYDGVYGVGEAIKKLQAASLPVTREAIVSTLKNLTYEGVLGTVKFDSALDKASSYDLVNWQGSKTGVAFGVNEAAKLTMNFQPINPAGETKVVWDGFTIEDGELLETKQTGALSALSFFVSALSSWTALVLVEQSVYAVQNRQSHWLWTILGALVFGLCGVWGSVVINFGSVELSDLGHIALEPAKTGGTLILASFCILIGYALALKGIQRLHFPKQGKGKRGTNGQQEHSVTEKHSQTYTYTPASGPKSSESIEAEELAKTSKSQFTQLPSKINRWLIAGAVTSGATLLATLSIITFAINPMFKIQMGGGYIFLNLLIAFVFFFFGLLFLFHFMPQTPIRGVGALIMALAVYLPTEALLLNSDFYYIASGVLVDQSEYWIYEDLTLGLSIVTVLLCLCLIAYNVFSMKLSRNSLDVHLVQFKRQFKIMTLQADQHRGFIGKLTKERDDLWRLLDLINLSRPLVRDHSLAIALADYVQDHAALQGIVMNQGSAQGLVPEDVTSVRPKHNEASIMHRYEQLIKQATGPQRELRLEDVIAHPVTLELLKDAMAKNMDVESLMLYLDIQRYKQMTNQKVRAFMAREIYDTFLARGAKYEVNVSDTLRRSFDTRFAYDKGQLSPAAESALPVDFFADVEREMRTLLQTNGMARLQSSGMYALCNQLLTLLKAPVASNTNISTGGPGTPGRASTPVKGAERSGTPVRSSSPGREGLRPLKASGSAPRGSIVVSPTHSTPRQTPIVNTRPSAPANDEYPSPTPEAVTIPIASVAWGQ